MIGWTEDQIADLRDYVGLGYKLDEILTETGRERGEVEAKIVEIGLASAPKDSNLSGGPSSDGRAEEGARDALPCSSASYPLWSTMSREAILAAIKAGDAVGLSYSAIARRHGTSRNAVSGYVDRYRDEIGIPKDKVRATRTGMKAAPKPRKPAPLVTVARQPRPARPASPSMVTPIRRVFVPAVDALPTGTHRVSFLASRDFVCKAFLAGEPQTHAGMICGNPVPPDRQNRFCDACSAGFFSRKAVLSAEDLAASKDARRRAA